MASRGRKPQGARRKSMWTDNPNFDPHWDQLWWGRKATDVTSSFHPPPPAHSGKPPPFDKDRVPINPYDYTPYQWPVHAIDHTSKTEYALDAARKPEKPTDTRSYAAPILKETTKPESEKSYTKPLGLHTLCGEKPYSTASKFTTRSVAEPGVKELTPHVFAHPEAMGPPLPKPDNVLQSKTVPSPSPPPACAPAGSQSPPSTKPPSPAPASRPASPASSAPCPSNPAPEPAKTVVTRPDQFDINPSTYKSAWGGGHKDKERKKPWPKPYEKAMEFAHHKTDITKGVMIFEPV